MARVNGGSRSWGPRTGAGRSASRGALWFAGVGGGLLGGSTTGVLEALWILTSTAPSEYQAVLYGTLLYGAVGALLGSGVGVLAVAGSSARRPSPAVVWCVGYFGVVSSLGWFILRYLLNRDVFLEDGVPTGVLWGVAGGLAVASAIGVWLGNNLLTKTPLRALTRPKGTAALWGGGAGLALMVSVAPAPTTTGLEVPHHPQDGTGGRPNIILVQVDALRYDALGVDVVGTPAGEHPSESPHLDEFARGAVVFEQHIAAASWTRASVASLFTGLTASSHGCMTKHDVLRSDVVTLAEALAGANYATGGFPDNPNVTAGFGFGQGFDWYPYSPQYPLGATESSYGLSLYSVARKLYARVHTTHRVEEYYAPAEAQLAQLTAWIDGQGRDRWFGYVHIMEPHDPYFRHPLDGSAYARAAHAEPTPAEAADLRALYDGEVRHADEELGRFFAALKTDGLYDDALIIVTSDHGEEFHEHGGWWHGTTLYDEEIHVPLLVKLPHQARAGTRVSWQTRAIDVPATILDVAGVPVPDNWQGETLFPDDFDQQLALTFPPVVEPGDPLLPWTRPTWAQLPASRAAISEEDFDGYALQSIRADGRKLIEGLVVPADDPHRQPSEALYDLIADPQEHRLIPDDPAKEGLRVRLMTSVGSPNGDSLTTPFPTRRPGLALLGYTEDGK